MKTFLYRVKDDMGRSLFGVTEATGAQDIKKMFRSSEFYFISAEGFDPRSLFKIELSLEQLVMFTHRLA